MNALLRKKREWEFQNEQYLLRLVETSADVSVESVKKAGLVTSFLLYIMYKTLGGVLAIAAALFQGPRLVRYSAPEQYEFLDTHVARNSQFQNPFQF